MEHQTELWYVEIGESYNQAMIALVNAVRLKNQWVGDPDYADAVATKEDLLKSVGHDHLTCGDRCSFEDWVKSSYDWVPDQCPNHNGLVPSELAVAIFVNNQKYATAHKKAQEDFDPTLWFSIPFARAIEAQMV